jgi:serine/threonine-protein kinase
MMAPMECLDATTLFDLFAAGQARAERDRLDDHLDRCERCRELVAAYVLVADDDRVSINADTVIGTPPVEDRPAGGPAPSLGATEPAPHPPALRHFRGEIVEGRYRLARVVGEGGMGVVWAARDQETGRDVALKMLKVDSPLLTRRVLREAHVASVIGHPNVVEVRAVLVPPGAPPVLVMDLLEGESLDRVISARGRIPAAEVVPVLMPLVGALRAAHQRGVLHRDLKPQNVFLARDDGDPRAPPVVMLLDFGLAKLIGHDVEALTRTGAIVGTPHYMAPEQLFGESDVDARADVWAIGAIAYECLSGRRPLEGSSYAQLVRSATRRALRSLGDVAPEVPPALSSLVDRMLAHEREGRPALFEVHAALEALSGVL